MCTLILHKIFKNIFMNNKTNRFNDLFIALCWPQHIELFVLVWSVEVKNSRKVKISTRHFRLSFTSAYTCVLSSTQRWLNCRQISSRCLGSLEIGEKRLKPEKPTWQSSALIDRSALMAHWTNAKYFRNDCMEPAVLDFWSVFDSGTFPVSFTSNKTGRASTGVVYLRFSLNSPLLLSLYSTPQGSSHAGNRSSPNRSVRQPDRIQGEWCFDSNSSELYCY